MVLVPMEPTNKMMEAALYDYLGYEKQGPNKSPWNARSMWDAMLIAWENEIKPHAQRA